jgi:hypothetical protein
MGVVSQEKAAEIAGLCREDFLMSLLKFRVSPFQYTAEEVLKEAGYQCLHSSIAALNLGQNESEVLALEKPRTGVSTSSEIL